VGTIDLIAIAGLAPPTSDSPDRWAQAQVRAAW
jgi:hypothetical protein